MKSWFRERLLRGRFTVNAPVLTHEVHALDGGFIDEAYHEWNSACRLGELPPFGKCSGSKTWHSFLKLAAGLRWIKRP